MKKTIVLHFIFAFFAVASVAQGKIFKNPIHVSDKPKGSEYLTELFASAKVDNIDQKSFMRYNVFKDEFEFITTKNDTLILDKIADLGNINFIATKTKYKYVTYTNSNGKIINGYLISLYEKGEYILFKKQNITLLEEKIARTSLEANMPAKYVKSSDSYYLKNNNTGIVEFPSNKKGIVKLYPERKAAIETFVKENKIDFDQERDMIKIIDFLAS